MSECVTVRKKSGDRAPKERVASEPMSGNVSQWGVPEIQGQEAVLQTEGCQSRDIR